MSFSDAAINAMLDSVFKVSSIAWTNVWVSLHTADPGATGANESTVTGYARIDATGLFSAAVAGVITNNAIIGEFSGTSGSPQTVTHFGVWTAVSGGTFIVGGTLTPSRPLGPSNGVNIIAGQLTVDVSSP